MSTGWFRPEAVVQIPEGQAKMQLNHQQNVDAIHGLVCAGLDFLPSCQLELLASIMLKQLRSNVIHSRQSGPDLAIGRIRK